MVAVAEVVAAVGLVVAEPVTFLVPAVVLSVVVAIVVVWPLQPLVVDAMLQLVVAV